MSENHHHDQFGRWNAGSDCAKPGAEAGPNQGGSSRGDALKNPLRDESDLDEAMVGGEFALEGVAVLVGLAVAILYARVGADGAKRANGVLDGELDFEAQAVEPDDLDRVQT